MLLHRLCDQFGLKIVSCRESFGRNFEERTGGRPLQAVREVLHLGHVDNGGHDPDFFELGPGKNEMSLSGFLES